MCMWVCAYVCVCRGGAAVGGVERGGPERVVGVEGGEERGAGDAGWRGREGTRVLVSQKVRAAGREDKIQE